MLYVRRSRLYTLWFGWYSRRQFRRFFNSVRVLLDPALREMDLRVPVIFHCNHAYWWDGFWSQLLTEEYFCQNLHIIIEERQLQKHRFFTRLGAFSLNRENPRSAARTLSYAAELLLAPSERQNALWLFPQGRIEHVDRRPLGYYRGAASIVKRVLESRESIYLVSVVSRIEYLEEQKPELFLSIAPPEKVTRETFPGTERLTGLLEEETSARLDTLKENVIARRLEGARTLLRGKASINRRIETLRRFLRPIH
ncbi:MAG: glycerol acyltransferase [Pelodictyon luteolum]|uniref:Phospholipid/glycerol acyltransferase n=2 Tax=Pelodictyon luteolum TaxID=1100 RepID=Q3B3N1_CHLL3|nr:lysophospholipid acyltransferase family protein [Pelodictyon luteolum]ABB24050.1 Phospholipid/glycerol acyltransferase [Pelodictyon luteolum DSM 273]KZK75269.1 MAG: glycerol acyltransferase [Pelodictyon luteolum]